MELKKVEAQLEAILFTIGEAIELERLAQAVEHDEDTTKKILQNMMDRYVDESRGIQIIELDGSYQMCTKPSLYESIIKITKIPKKHILTEVLLETLSIIAYKQPVTKLQIEGIRGVKADHAVNKLVEYNLVCEVGRMDAPGRPILFGTTEEFLRCFGLQSLDSLPAINPEKVEDFKIEAEEEVEQLTLDI
ncbi:MAG: SMC-Scp complex subunit ScpB [Clostridiales bacterium]|nr:SMC-Scp complex subunit ScpB [Clostridiales bacterium]